MTNFWCSAFCLPQACIDETESMCSARAKIAWEEVCCPIAEGVLGIRRVKEVSNVFVLNLI